MNETENVKETAETIREKYRTQLNVILENTDIADRQAEEDRIVCDLLRVTGESAFSVSEYFMYDFAHKSPAEQSAFLPEKATFEMFYRLNDSASIDYNTRNKWEVYRRLSPYYRRKICLVKGPEHKRALFDLLQKEHRLFCKPLCGSLGEKIKIIKDTDPLTDEFFQQLLDYYAPEGFLAEELIRQCDFMMRLNPTSVNTLRVMTIRLDERICMYYEFKIGEMFSVVDNLGKRSLICGVDTRDGTIISAYNKNRASFPRHPHTRAPVIGEKIPRFHEATELAKELAGHFPGFRYLSWDLSLTDEGWAVVELNGKGGVCGYQEVYNRGIRRDMEGYLAELHQPIGFQGLLDHGYSPKKAESCPHAEYPLS